MAWFKKVRKPIESANKESRVPEGLWVKCPSCAQIIYNKDLAASLSVCTKCAHHFRLTAAERLRSLFDGTWTEHDTGLRSTDPLRFTDTKPYIKRLETTIASTGMLDAVVTATGQIGGRDVVVARWSTRSSAAAWEWSSGKRSPGPSKPPSSTSSRS
jgi:acetyl-CoA carboxylase carboxyl transferase subunit beta